MTFDAYKHNPNVIREYERFPVLRPARTLAESRRTLDPDALRTRAELDAFYRPIRESVRGSAIVPILRKGLDRSHTDPFYKGFLMGRSGVGKSTEVSKLLLEVSNRYVGIRFSARSDLDPLSFKPFDVLLLASMLLVEETANLGSPPSPDVIKPVLLWYADIKTTTDQRLDGSLSATLGASVPDSSWLHKVLGFFGSVKGELKFTGARSTTVVEYSLNRIDTLISAVNGLLLECRRLLWEAKGKEWILIGEEFDKEQIGRTLARDLFVTYGNILSSLDINLIFNLPLRLLYSPLSNNLPSFRRVMIHDTPIYDQNRELNPASMQDLKSILWARMVPSLFVPGVEDNLIIASGGQLRSLFRLVTAAREFAAGEIIEGRDAKRAIQQDRRLFEMQLGEQEGLEGEPPIPIADKLEKLLAVYSRQPDARVPDRTLNELITSGHVQDFNGNGWFGLHPLTVDILKLLERLGPEESGGVPL